MVIQYVAACGHCGLVYPQPLFLPIIRSNTGIEVQILTQAALSDVHAYELSRIGTPDHTAELCYSSP